MHGWFGRILRAVVYSLATLVIVLALLVGLVRLLLPLVPDYREEVRRIATQATGLDVDFQRLSASWPLRGPELQLYEVRLLNPLDQSQVLAARQVNVGIGLVRLLREGALVPSRVSVTGARLELARDATGGWTVQGRAPGDWLPTASTRPRRVPEIDVVLADIELLYRDTRPGGGLLPALLDRLELRIGTDAVLADGRLELADGTAGQVDFDAALDGAIPTDAADFAALHWRLSLAAEGLDLPLLLTTALRHDTALKAAQGGVRADARLVGARPRNVAVELDINAVRLATADGIAAEYPRVTGKLAWQQRDDGWLLDATDLDLGRADATPPVNLRVESTPAPDGDGRDLALRSAFLPLEVLYPAVQAVATPAARADLLPAALRGQLRDAELRVQTRPGRPARYSASVRFQDLGVVDAPGGVTLAGLSGEVVGDQDGGRLQLDSRGLQLALPEIFAGPLAADSLSAFLIWRVTADAIRVLSDRVEISAPELTARSRFELRLPRAGGSAFLDLDGNASGSAPAVVPYLPLRKFPPPVGDWLVRAVRAGEGTGRIRFRGPLAEFPYDHGEGEFRVDLDVQDAVLDYADRWPPVEDLAGQFVFDGVSLSTVSNTARIAGLPLRDRNVRLPDLRRGLLEISGEQAMDLGQLLGLLRATPVAELLGPVMARVQAAGPVDTRLALSIPVLRPADYRLRASLDNRGGRLGLDGVNFGFEDLRGRVEVRNTRLEADGLSARLLGAPVSVKLRSGGSGAPYGEYALVTGRIPPRQWMDTLGLPHPERVAGDADWRAMALVPAAGRADGAELRVLVRSSLGDTGSSFPAPLAKAAGMPAPLALTLGFPADGELRVDGTLRDDLAWALHLRNTTSGWQVERGLVQAGGGRPALPEQPGLAVQGRLAELRVGDWLALLGDGVASGPGSRYRELRLAVARLGAFGQVFRDAGLVATREADAWRVNVTGPAAEGSILVPPRATADRPLRLDLDRLWLQETDTGDAGEGDPRSLPATRVAVADFRLGRLRFGRLAARLEPLADGIAARDIDVQGGSFTLRGDGDWRQPGAATATQRSSLRLDLQSTEVADTLRRLDYGAVIQGRRATASADLRWPGAPQADFLDNASGSFRFRVDEGTLLEVDPGGGRLLGILSVSALPRRLALDFSDVIDEGLGFDVLQGDFSIENGNAYTCNLGLEGSVADLGIVGRVGLRDRDYDQLAVVRPHVSGVLALGGAVMGGPGVGAAMFLLSQIFRKPLSQLGETYYRVTGSWESSSVERVQRSELDASRFKDCERYLAEVVPETVRDQVTEPGTELPPELVP